MGADGALSRTRHLLSVKGFIEPDWKSGLAANWKYRFLSCLLRGLPWLCEETAQGQRSYRWFRPAST
ncbi:hypothetical protein D1AOALGA4SA_1166 [Olavius algarvensis Delta 1 endosymbiont]|nr:hypothetical protein D1AOALGA4SA_1166 [Olavius algarvensis Delta 1 endosymbiont]